VDVIDEQVEYYRRRAGEYDEWWFREGRWALPEPARHRWLADVEEVEAALERFAPGGEVLEFACGTGLWTRHLVRHADRLTAVDAAPEMIARNRDRVAGEVTYVRADIFDWTPPAHRFDVCFFSYWLSHVPDQRLAAFWAKVAAALRPGGRVSLIDSHDAPPRPERTQPRVLNDGSRYTVVKRFWEPDELVAHTARLGFTLDAHVTGHGGILYAAGRLATQ
jgi:SAM-dependent methyltransferase